MSVMQCVCVYVYGCVCMCEEVPCVYVSEGVSVFGSIYICPCVHV